VVPTTPLTLSKRVVGTRIIGTEQYFIALFDGTRGSSGHSLVGISVSFAGIVCGAARDSHLNLGTKLAYYCFVGMNGSIHNQTTNEILVKISSSSTQTLSPT
jgi:hypothetical protein